MSEHSELVLARVATLLEAALLRLPDTEAAALCRLAAVRLREPEAFVTVAGETSTGKSTLINGLLGTPLLPTFARPTTATVTQVVCLEQAPPRFLAVYQDATQEDLGYDRFVTLTGDPPEDLLRLQVRAAPTDRDLLGLQVFDTPGYNAVVSAHEEVLRRFLPESDVIVFVTGYRTGFGQVDQDLLEVIRQCTEDDPGIPVLLVVNRAPPGAGPNDKRVQEVMSNAADCLHRLPELVIIPTASPGSDAPGASPGPAVPDTGRLWNAVLTHVESPERRGMIRRKLQQLLVQLCEGGREVLRRRHALLEATSGDVDEIRERAQALGKARTDSRAAVARSAQRLETLLPPSLDRLAEAIRQKLVADIERSGKWLGKDDCLHWIVSHALPFEVRAASKQVEEAIRVELERLDRELQDIANTAVARLEHVVTLESDASSKFVASMVQTLTARLGGATFGSVTRAFGGVGGAAAGTGNLVKMLVSRAGGVFGKTFSREVYNQIGRTFTKRALQRLNVAVAIIIDVAAFIHDAHTWQGKLRKQVEESIMQWRNDLKSEVIEKQVPSIREANERGIDDIYAALITEVQTTIDEQASSVAAGSADIDRLGREFDAIRHDLNTMSAHGAG